MTIIKQNYDTLNLKMDCTFENHPEYIENPNQITYFNQLVRLFTNEIRNTIITDVVDAPLELLQSLSNNANSNDNNNNNDNGKNNNNSSSSRSLKKTAQNSN